MSAFGPQPQEEIDRLSGLRFRTLTFQRPLENHFQASTRDTRARRLWLEGLLAIILFNLFLAANFFFSRGEYTSAVLCRLALLTPVALLVNVAMRFRPQEWLREGSVALVALAAGLLELLVESHHSPAHSVFAQFGVAAVLVFANTVMRLRFPYALLTSLALVGADTLFLLQDKLLTHGEKLMGLTMMGCTSLLTMVSNYSQNREERLTFLLRLRGEQLIETLSRSNHELAVTAETDSLTRLANRYAFDRRLADVWAQAQAAESLLSVILIDVDHFKRLNDTFGHVYGDKVLKRIAHLLGEGLRKQEDFAARFGGEEFVILLPGTNQEGAVLVAERLRRMIELAGSPALEGENASLQGARTTVSCGVACDTPAAMRRFEHLLQQADEALYQAKAQGRNRVCVAGTRARRSLDRNPDRNPDRNSDRPLEHTANLAEPRTPDPAPGPNSDLSRALDGKLDLDLSLDLNLDLTLQPAIVGSAFDAGFTGAHSRRARRG